MAQKTIDITTLPGYANLPDGTYTITARASAAGKATSDPSAGVSYTKSSMPTKGDIITMNIDGSNKAYRVLKVDGSNVEVVSMSDIGYSKFNDTDDNTYFGSTLDTYLNTTYYNTLTSTAKAAIVDNYIIEDIWLWGNDGDPDFAGKYGTTKPGTSSYTISFDKFDNLRYPYTRHVYALSIQDVLDYIKDTSIGDGELQNYNIWKMFWNDEVSHSGRFWIRSNYSYRFAWTIYGSNGCIGSDAGARVIYEALVRPAFTIDLSKISWS